jgi:hypothetical protein
MLRKVLLSVLVCTVVVGVSAPLAFGDLVALRGGGVELDAPEGWAKVERRTEPSTADPRTLLVVGTKGVRPVESGCQVASYRVPDDGAAVVVIGWKDGILDDQTLTLSKLQRGLFACFAGRGAAGQVARKGRDYQVNVLLGDVASARTVRDALAVARSFSTVR